MPAPRHVLPYSIRVEYNGLTMAQTIVTGTPFVRKSCEPYHGVGHTKLHYQACLYFINSHRNTNRYLLLARHSTSKMEKPRLRKNFETHRPGALAFEESHTDARSGEIVFTAKETESVLKHTARLTRLITGVFSCIENRENRAAIATLRRDIRLAKERSEEGIEEGSVRRSGEDSNEESMETAFARRARDIYDRVWDSTATGYRVSPRLTFRT
jgi:hypothetical protein